MAQQSVDAYVGCIAGAVMKKHYLTAIQSAGFRDVMVVGEDVYPIRLAITDPVSKAIYSDTSVVSENAEGILESVASIKVSAVKRS